MNKKGLVSYELELPSHVRVHNCFHASLLKKCVYNTKHVIDWYLLEVEPDEEFVSVPLHILEKREVQLEKRTTLQLKVQWNHYKPKEDTWKNETTLKSNYPTFI